MTSVCPICGHPAEDIHDEIAHMEAEHPDVIKERLTKAGFRYEDGRWVDLLSDPNG